MWCDERKAVVLNTLRELNSEQLIHLSQSEVDIPSLNWFDFDLTKGTELNNNKRKKGKKGA